MPLRWSAVPCHRVTEHCLTIALRGFSFAVPGLAYPSVAVARRWGAFPSLCHASPCHSDARPCGSFRNLALDLLCVAFPLPRTADQCRFDTSPCKAPAVRYHSEQCDSFAVPCRAVPLHCLSFDALPQQFISQPRDALASRCRTRPRNSIASPCTLSFSVGSLCNSTHLRRSAPLNFAVAGRCYAVAYPALLMAIWYQILTRMSQRVWLPTVRTISVLASMTTASGVNRQPSGLTRSPQAFAIRRFPCTPRYLFTGHAVRRSISRPFKKMFLSRLCPCYTVPRFALAHLFCALPSLSDAYHCPRCSARCFALATPGQSLPLPGYESVTIVILKNTEVKSKWIRKRKFGVLHKRRGFVLCVSHKRAGSGA